MHVNMKDTDIHKCILWMLADKRWGEKKNKNIENAAFPSCVFVFAEFSLFFRRRLKCNHLEMHPEQHNAIYFPTIYSHALKL